VVVDGSDEGELFRACEDGRDQLVSRLLKAGVVDPAARQNHAIREASQNGHSGVVKVLLCDQRVDPCAFDNLALRRASRNGHVEVVKVLLADSRIVGNGGVNPGALFSACQHGHVKIVKLLLVSNPLVYQPDEVAFAVRLAKLYEQHDVVNFLLHDDRVKQLLGKEEYTSILHDCTDTVGNEVKVKAWQLATVQRLVADRRLDAAAMGCKLLKCASKLGRVEIVEALLEDRNVDVGVNDNYPIRWASRNGHLEVVNLLLKGGEEACRVDPSAKDNWGLRWAFHNGHAEVVARLVQDSRVAVLYDGQDGEDPSDDEAWNYYSSDDEGSVALDDRDDCEDEECIF
jgi:hypothetical protein